MYLSRVSVDRQQHVFFCSCLLSLFSVLSSHTRSSAMSSRISVSLSSVRKRRVSFCIFFFSPHWWAHGWPGQPSYRKGEVLGASALMSLEGHSLHLPAASLSSFSLSRRCVLVRRLFRLSSFTNTVARLLSRKETQRRVVEPGNSETSGNFKHFGQWDILKRGIARITKTKGAINKCLYLCVRMWVTVRM